MITLPDDFWEGLFKWIVSGLLVLLGAIAGWVWVKNDRRSDEQDRRIDVIENLAQELRLKHVEAANEVTKLRLHVSENFSNKAETQSSLARIHEKIENMDIGVTGKIEKLNDDVTKKIDALRTDVREDIRLAMTGGHR